MLWRRAIPILLIAIGVGLLTGCFYLPLPEHPIRDPGKDKKEPLPKDFRHILGDVNSKSPIRPGLTRAQVYSVLGKPNYRSTDNELIYIMLAERAVWVYPLCFFAAAPAQFRGYALRLTFKDDILVRWELAHSEENRDPIWMGYGSKAPYEAADNLQSKGPSRSAALPTTQP